MEKGHLDEIIGKAKLRDNLDEDVIILESIIQGILKGEKTFLNSVGGYTHSVS